MKYTVIYGINEESQEPNILVHYEHGYGLLTFEKYNSNIVIHTPQITFSAFCSTYSQLTCIEALVFEDDLLIFLDQVDAFKERAFIFYRNLEILT